MAQAEMSPHTVSLTPIHIPPGWMVAPRSYLVDRILADVEMVLLPARKSGGGSFRITAAEQVFHRPRRHWIKRALQGELAGHITPLPEDQGPVVDLRAEDPENWAHFLNIHLAILALICRETGHGPDEMQLVLPKETPGYIRQLAALIGLRAHYTDAPVSGFGFAWQIEHADNIRGVRGALLNDPAISPVAAALASERITPAQTPRKLFLSRRGTRALVNEDEIAAMLATRGFVKVYMEELDPGMQLRYGVQAEEIVAIHGAALAPILYRGPQAPALRLIELFPVGHITNVYRAAMAALGGSWCAVRGHLEAAQLPEIYKLDSPYLKHSLDRFRVDPVSLEVALEMPAPPCATPRDR